MNNIKTRNILKLVGGIISDKELNIVSQNENVVVIKTKIKYNSYELPKYISNNRMKINHNDEKRPDEYILKVMCKDPNNKYAISLLDKFE